MHTRVDHRKIRRIKRERTLPGGIEGPHVEDVNALHLSDEFKTLETSGLLEVGGNGTGLSTGGDEVLLGLDLCCGNEPVSIVCQSVVGGESRC